MYGTTERPAVGSSRGFQPSPYRVPERDLPPTPPVHEVDSPVESADAPYDAFSSPSAGLSFSEPAVPQRPRRGRRPASVYPAPGAAPLYQPQRKYTDPTPRTRRYAESEDEESGDPQQLDVDLDAYSTADFEGVDGLEDREPTLSFVTTSTVESTASTPSIGVTYGYGSEAVDGKPEPEPRIRMRTTAGRSNAYSSAESSMASGAYSYNPYGDNQIYHPHPPPMPVVPNAYALPTEQVGLGITADDLVIPARPRESQLGSSSSKPPLSPSNSFVHRPWRGDVVNRLRSDSASSSFTTASVSTSDTALSTSDHAAAYPYAAYQQAERLPWEQESPVETRSEAIALVDEGRGKILNTEKLQEMGGLEALTEATIGSLTGMCTNKLLQLC